MADIESSDGALTAKIQLAVDLTCNKCVQDINSCLSADSSIKNVAINLEKQTVILETSLPTHEIVQLIEATGKKALVTGVGAAGSQIANLGSAVAIMHEGNPSSRVRGITRIVQSTMATSIIDGTLDGLSPNAAHRLGIHEYGDISDGCNSCGDIFDVVNDTFGNHKLSNCRYGDLGYIHSDSSGRSTFRIESERIKVWNIIGRSMVVSSKCENDPPSWTKLACGIIARSAGLFENVKRICACDGTTIWNEKVTNDKGNTRSSQL